VKFSDKWKLLLSKYKDWQGSDALRIPVSDSFNLRLPQKFKESSNTGKRGITDAGRKIYSGNYSC